MLPTSRAPGLPEKRLAAAVYADMSYRSHAHLFLRRAFALAPLILLGSLVLSACGGSGVPKDMEQEDLGTPNPQDISREVDDSPTAGTGADSPPPAPDGDTPGGPSDGGSPPAASAPTPKPPSRRPATTPPRTAGGNAAPSVPPVPSAAVAAPRLRTVTIPAGTALTVALQNALATDKSQRGDEVTATLAQNVEFDGVVVMRAGDRLTGEVSEVKKAPRFRGRALLAVTFTRVSRGDAVIDIVAPIRMEAEGRGLLPVLAGGTAGAIISKVTGKSVVKGIIVGTGAGVAVLAATRGKELDLPAGTSMTIPLAQSVSTTVSAR